MRRDILRRSSIGALVTRRSVALGGVGSNEAYGLDGRFAFFQNLTFDTYWAQTRTGGVTGDDTSYRAQLTYAGDRYGLIAHRLVVGKHFNPEVGFLFRNDIAKYFTQLRFSPRPAAIKRVRKLSVVGQVDYFENGAGQVVTRELQGEFIVEFENSDMFNLAYLDSYEFLEAPFEIALGVTIPVGSYRFGTASTSFTLGQQRAVSGTAFVERGLVLGRRQDRGRLSSGTCQPHVAAVGRTQPLVQSRLFALRVVHVQPGRLAGDLYDHPADVRQWAGPVQLEQRRRRHEPAAAVGIPARQRAVRRLQ